MDPVIQTAALIKTILEGGKLLVDLVKEFITPLKKSDDAPDLMKVGVLIELYGTLTRMTGFSDEIIRILSLRDRKITEREKRTLLYFFGQIPDLLTKLTDLNQSILDIYYPGLSEALEKARYIDVETLYLLKEIFAPRFGISDGDVKKIYKKLRNDRYHKMDNLFFMLPKVNYSILGSEESVELPKYYGNSNFRDALICLVNNLVECRQFVAKIIRDNWDVKELIVNK